MPQRAILDDRSVLALSGPEARDFLQGLITNDMARLDGQEAIYTGLLTPQGKLLFDFFVVRNPRGGFYIDCARDRSADLLKRLSLYKLRAKVELGPADLAVGAVWGEDQNSAAEGAVSYADPRLPELGRRLIAPRAALESFTGAAETYHAHRIALGVPDSADLPPDSVFALDAGFEELNGVNFKKGCYVGQEVTSRMKHRASARRRFLIAETAQKLPPGTALEAAGREVGTLGAGAGNRALTLVRLDRVAEAREAGTPITAGGSPVALTAPPWLKI